MGKKKGSSNGGEEKKEDKARAFVLKVSMHCNCKGCNDKIRAAVKDITLLPGIDAWDQSALESKGELKLVATADPEKLRQRLHKATRKNVDLIFPKDNKDASKQQGQTAAHDAQAALLLNRLLQQQQGQNAWAANQVLPSAGGGWNTHGAYPWAVHVQQPDPYAAYAYPPAGAAAAWGAYAYPPGPWHGHGY